MTDPELDALRKIVQALDQLDPPTRTRAVRWLVERYGPYNEPALAGGKDLSDTQESP